MDEAYDYWQPAIAPFLGAVLACPGPMLFQESHDDMRCYIWHEDQKSVCALVLAMVKQAQTSRQIRSQSP